MSKKRNRQNRYKIPIIHSTISSEEREIQKLENELRTKNLSNAEINKRKTKISLLETKL